MSNIKQIGIISLEVINLLKLDIPSNTPILIGDANSNHMQTSHPDDYNKYFIEIENIIANPDYVIPNPKDNSLQYIKEFESFVLLAVRITGGGSYFARSLYVMSSGKIERFASKDLFNKYKIKK